MKHVILIAAAFALPAAAMAQAGVAITSKIFVAKTVTDASGVKKNVLVDPDRVLPNDPLAVVLTYQNGTGKPATNFVINNPVPQAVAFTGVAETWAVVSVDGGKTFGPLATLKVAKGDGTMRPAIAADVTAVRWKFTRPIAPGETGKVTFYGMVK